MRERLALERCGGLRVVHVAIGDLAGVNADALDFAFTCMVRDTPLASAKLAVERVAVTVACRMCGGTSAVSDWRFRCAHCGSDAVSVATGRELELRSLEVDEHGEEARCTTSP